MSHTHENTVDIMPNEDEVFKFKNHESKLKHPFVLYADFESVIKPIHGCKPNIDKSYTTLNTKHIPCGFCVHTKSEVPELESTPFIFRGSDGTSVVKTFLERLEMYAKMYFTITRPKNIRPIVMSKADRVHFTTNNVCHICTCEDGISGERKVRDHCHIKYRGPAHELCNLNYKYPMFIPLYFHNISGYDAHLFVKELANFSSTPLNIIPNNEENYISFSKNFIVDSFMRDGKLVEITRTIRFLDTLRLMPSALDKLMRNITNNKLFRETQK